MYTNGSRSSQDEKAPVGLHYHPPALGSLFEAKVNPWYVSRTRTCIQPYMCIGRVLRAISMGIRPAEPGLHPKDNPRCPFYVLTVLYVLHLPFYLSHSLFLLISGIRVFSLCHPLWVNPRNITVQPLYQRTNHSPKKLLPRTGFPCIPIKSTWDPTRFYTTRCH